MASLPKADNGGKGYERTPASAYGKDNLVETAAVSSVRIHPAIGIARIGNSLSSYFIGPEVSAPIPKPAGFYKDGQGKLKRQAARFRIYAYDAGGNVLGEITTKNAQVEWTVHVANKKAAWYDFDVALDIPEAAQQQSQIRNAGFAGEKRSELVIDSGSRTVSGPNANPAPFDTGSFVGSPVYLGEIFTDELGHLVVLGGRGVSASFDGVQSPFTFANNDGWHDDTSDGPVHARVMINGQWMQADPAWVVVAPPNYAPEIVTPQTMYDVIFDALAGLSLAAPETPSFRNDILPLLEQCVQAQWVNDGFLTTFGWDGPWRFTADELLRRLSQPKPEHGDDAFRELRIQVFNQFRDPSAATPQPLAWPPMYGDAFGNFYTSPRVYFSVTATKYALLKKWSEGNFINDLGKPQEVWTRIEDAPLQLQPAMLDRSALHWCMGGPFHPGCELTWPMRQASMYRAPFRVRERPATIPEVDYGPFITWNAISNSDGPLFWSAPGDLTRWMAVPWQTDTASCRSGYLDWSPAVNPYSNDGFIPTFWPSRVPNDVMTEGQFSIVTDASRPLEERLRAFHHRVRWLRGFDYSSPYIGQITRMITEFGDLGVVETRQNPNGSDDPFPQTMHVESRPSVKADEDVLRRAHEFRAVLRPDISFTKVRFGWLGRR